MCAGIMSPSPVQEYIEAVEDLPDQGRATVKDVLNPMLKSLDLDENELCVEGTAFYALQSCMNHSCQPNAHVLRSADDPGSFAVIVAKYNISAGEEITISYVDESLSYEERQEALQDYGFVCSCSLCQQQSPTSGSH